MRAPGAEVKSCPRCRVTAPPEYRRCLHCGSRLVSGAPHPGLRLATAASGEERFQEVAPGVILEPAGGELHPEQAAEQEAPRSALGRIPWFWLLLLLIPVLRRACAPE